MVELMRAFSDERASRGRKRSVLLLPSFDAMWSLLFSILAYLLRSKSLDLISDREKPGVKHMKLTNFSVYMVVESMVRILCDAVGEKEDLSTELHFCYTLLKTKINVYNCNAFTK